MLTKFMVNAENTWHMHTIKIKVNNNLCKALFLRNDDHSSQ